MTPFRTPALGLFLVALVAAGPASAQSFLDRARDAMRDAAHEVENAAKDAGRSVQDFLVDNPDLNRDIVDFGKRVGVPGFEGAGPERGAHIILSQKSAPPGAAVELSAVGLPGAASVVIAAGATVQSATPVGEATTTERGRLDTSVTVPAAAKPGDTLLFVVETPDGRLRLASAPLAVADPAAFVTVTGTLSNEGATCPALRGDDGKLYTLVPTETGAFGPGDRVKVTGTVAEMSTCMQGTTLSVTSIAAP